MKDPHEAQVIATFVCIGYNLYQLYRYYESQRSRERNILTFKQFKISLYRSLIFWSVGVEIQD